MKMLVIGYGNELRGDDNLGPFLVKELEQELRSYSEEISFLALPQLDVTLAPAFRGVEAVIFVDARADEDEAPVVVRQVFPTPGPVRMGNTSHGATIQELLQVARDWYNAIPTSYAVLPKGYEFPCGFHLSAKARVAAGLARRHVLDLISRLGGLPV
jgi:hydrogenase maturation protease